MGTLNRHRAASAACAVSLVAAGLLLCVPPDTRSQQPSPSCAAPHTIQWPAKSPVWTLCWLAPNASSGHSGSGLELLHVFYKGHEVLYQAHIPVLNVKYDPGGCGGANLSYRDWANQLAPFDANNVKIPGVYAEPTVPPTTVCDHPGTDKGTFSGVAAEMRPNQLILTTQMSAGWYRYIQKWIFLPNGVIETRFAFTAVDYACVYKPHHHHVYWRLDFDIDGAANNVVEEFGLPAKTWTAFKTETKRFNAPSQGRKWRVRNLKTERGYEIIPGANDGRADETPAIQTFADADLWALHYHPNEIDDGGSTSGPNADAAHISKYLNGENIYGQDIVVWYRAGHRHVAMPGHIGCETVGPNLVPFGNW